MRKNAEGRIAAETGTTSGRTGKVRVQADDCGRLQAVCGQFLKFRLTGRRVRCILCPRASFCLPPRRVASAPLARNLPLAGRKERGTGV